MGMKDVELKSYQRVLCNIGYAISTLLGIAVGVVVGMMIYDIQLPAVVSVFICIGAATVVTSLCCSYIWIISALARIVRAQCTSDTNCA